MLKPLAIAAPPFISGEVGARSLTSSDPASLHNALRIGAHRSATGEGAWGSSSWADSRRARSSQTLLLDSADDVDAMLKVMEARETNVLFIGAMSICLPGAILCASRAKLAFGDEVCVVLGGRHVTESFYLDRSGEIKHHPSSPLRLMEEGLIDPVFDLVVSGDGEYVIADIGELIDSVVSNGNPAADVKRHVAEIAKAPGRWLCGWMDDGVIRTQIGCGPPLDQNQLPPPCALFSVNSSFDVFHGRRTAHVFSDSGPGCIYDCAFCSERKSVAGAPRDMNSAADRLFKQVQAAHQTIREEHPNDGASVFVEDSTLLGMQNASLKRLISLLEASSMDLQFGVQMTLDQINSRPELLARLRDVGLRYLFVGLETFAPAEIGGMSKDVRRRNDSWANRAERAFEMLNELGISCGAAVLFGLGESHRSRLRLIDAVGRWRREYRMPNPVSMNWAVQHPLRGGDGGANYRYLDWAVPEGPLLEVFRDFGEASLHYPLAGQPQPVLGEVREVRDGFCESRALVLPSTPNELHEVTYASND